MYSVIELQKNGGTLAVLHYEYADKNTAQQKYHEVLAYAAVSTLERHSAALLNEDGRELRYESYQHNVYTESEE